MCFKMSATFCLVTGFFCLKSFAPLLVRVFSLSPSKKASKICFAKFNQTTFHLRLSKLNHECLMKLLLELEKLFWSIKISDAKLQELAFT